MSKIIFKKNAGDQFRGDADCTRLCHQPSRSLFGKVNLLFQCQKDQNKVWISLISISNDCITVCVSWKSSFIDLQPCYNEKFTVSKDDLGTLDKGLFSTFYIKEVCKKKIFQILSKTFKIYPFYPNWVELGLGYMLKLEANRLFKCL